MKKSLVIFLQVILVALGIATLAFILWEPHLEGRNVNATNFEIYFQDPFLAYAYIASISFFVMLYQAFRLLGYVGQNKTFSPDSLKALQIIKRSARVLLAFVVAAEAYLFIVRPGDDIAGGVFIGLLMIVVSGTIAIVAGRYERTVQKVVDASLPQ